MEKKTSIDVKIYRPAVKINRTPEKNTGKTMVYSPMSEKGRNAV